MPRTPPSCLDWALAALGRRGHSVKELAGKLKEKGYPGKEIAETINRLEDLGYLNDLSFATARIRTRASASKWGEKRIRQELMQKGVASDVVEKALDIWVEEEQPESWEENAAALLQKKFKPLEKPDSDDIDARKQYEKDKAKRLNFLLRRGFGMAEALNAFNSVGSS